MSEAMSVAAAAGRAPSLRRRMASFIYEGLILFGMLLIPGAVGAIIVAITGQQHSAASDLVLQIVSFGLYAWYFAWFWSTRGQTLPMQTWHIRVVTADGQRLTMARGLARYLASWLWLAPAALVIGFNGWNLHDQPRTVIACAAASIVVYSLLSLFLPQRQFLHDILCRTRLVAAAPPEPRRKA